MNNTPGYNNVEFILNMYSLIKKLIHLKEKEDTAEILIGLMKWNSGHF